MILLDKIKKFWYLHILKRRYFRFGKCAKCGECCHHIYVRHENKIIKTAEEFENIKKTDDYSFYKHIDIIGHDDFGLIFSCQKYDEVNKICLEHRKRPSICRNYPSEKIFSFGAQLRDNCGYRFEPIEKFSEVFEKINKKPPKEFETIN